MRNKLLAVLAFIFLYCAAGISTAKDIQPKASHIDPENCKMCHEDRAKTIGVTGMGKIDCQTCHGNGSLHADAAGDKSNPGFATIVNPKKLTPENIAKNCLSCHKEGRLFWKTGVHANKNLSCLSCHNVHPKNIQRLNKALLIRPTETETCFTCHKDKLASVKRSSHMPVKEGKISCATCHDPHGTPTAKNLKAPTVNELCYKCHTEKRGPFLWEHAPVRDNCLTCHDAHGSQHDKMLVAKRPFLLCQRCHITTRHPSSLYDASAVNVENNRVFNRACLNCHSNIHGSNHPSGKTYLR